MKIRAPLKRRTALRSVSKRRQREGKEYSRLRKEFLALRPVCEAHHIVFPADGAWSADGKHRIYSEKATDIHHKKGRGPYFLDKSTWLACCRQCHDFCHANPKIAEKLGLLDKDRNKAINRIYE